VGCGAIGGEIARALVSGSVPGARLAMLVDQEPARCRSLANGLRPKPKTGTLAEAVAAADLVIEAAGMAAVSPVASAVLVGRKDLLVMSVGALLESPEWFDRFGKLNCRLHFPSGAVSGLDALKAAAAGKLKRVLLTTRKPPAGLAGAPFFKRRKIDPAAIKEPTVIFSGNARAAVRLFPANVNVAAAVALTGLGPEKTRVRIVADPAASRNSHTLEAEGDFGRLTAVTENVPSPHNPKTSRLAALSALALLRSLAAGSRQGT